MQGIRLALVLGCLAAVGCEGDGIRYRGSVDRTGTGLGTGTGTATGSTNNNTGNNVGLLGACDRIELDGTCAAYVGNDWTPTDAVAHCNNGTYTSGEQCPREDLLGFCAEAYGTTLEVWISYYDGAYYSDADVSLLQSNCELNGGSWIL